jgi:hypothetical protein
MESSSRGRLAPRSNKMESPQSCGARRPLGGAQDASNRHDSNEDSSSVWRRGK